MKTERFVPADQLAPAVAFNEWLRERLRSILDAAPSRREPARQSLSPNA